jgi:putative transcriptional regulator
MSGDSAPINLTNHFLIAMPGLMDALFAKSVIYVCEHSERGALGLVINKPASLCLSELFEKVSLPLLRQDLSESPVYQGGPVQVERGFVLHEPQPALDDGPSNPVYASTLSIPGGLDMTTSRDVLEAIANGSGPQKVLVSMGYSAWGQGQLETELGANAWLTVNADPAIIFDTPIQDRYAKALALLGLEAWMISSQVGHA